jgi:cyclopropane fatty-acyl-phospholipid synthase-like methyltransferase
MGESTNIIARYLSALKTGQSDEALRFSLGTRLFLRARYRLTPYSQMAAHLPRQGRILDLGCGHGLLGLTLALEAAEREVLGIDHDPARVKLAARAARGIANLSFEKGSLLAPPPGPWNGIAAIDVFHYFETRMQNAVLAHLRDALAPGGVFIMREVDPTGGIASRWNRAYEKIATRSGFTRSSEKQNLYFRAPADWVKQLESSGFEVQTERCSSPIFADILYVCRAR